MKSPLLRTFGSPQLVQSSPVHLLRSGPSHRLLSAGEGGFSCWDEAARRLVWTHEATCLPDSGVAFEEGGEIAVLATVDSKLLRVRMATGEVVSTRDLRQELGDGAGRSGARISPDGTRLVIEAGRMILYDLEARRAIGPLLPAGEALTSVTFSPDSRWLLGVLMDGRILRWDARGGGDPEELARYRDGYGTRVAFVPEGGRVLVGTRVGRVVVHAVADGSALQSLTAFPGDVTFLLPIDGRRAAVGGPEEIVILDLEGGAVQSLGQGEVAASAAALSTDGKRLYTGHASGAIQGWDLAGRRGLEDAGVHRGRIMGLWTDDALLFSWGSDLRFGQRDRGGGTATLQPLRPRRAAGFDFSPVRARALCAEAGGEIVVLQLEEGAFTPLGRLRGDEDAIHCRLFHQGDLALSIHEDSVICLWDVGSAIRKSKGSLTGKHLPWYRRFQKRATGRDKPIRRITLEDSGAVLLALVQGRIDLAVSPDGRRLAGISGDDLVMWNIESPGPGRKLPVRAAPLPHASFSADGRSLLVHTGQKTVSTYDATSGEARGTFDTVCDIRHLLELPGRGQVVICGEDGTVSWWDHAAGKRERCFEIPQELGRDVPVIAARCEHAGTLLVGTQRGLILELEG